MSGDPNLEKFLSEVDEVSGVIQGLVAGNDEANEKADKLLKKRNKRDENLGFNSSRINKVTDDPPARHEQSKESWMEEIANDAAKRADARRKRKEESDVLKTRGNEKFAAGDYQGAYDLYSQAIDIMKDNLPLWTNRAQVLIKIGKFEAAIEDCDFAFRIDDKCLKAFVHKSKAIAMLNKFEEARSILDEALDLNPQSKKIIAEYMQLVDELDKSHQLKQKVHEAKEENSEDFKTIEGVLHALRRENEAPFFYIGCLNCMAAMLRTEIDLTVFRSEDGFSVLREFHSKRLSSVAKLDKLQPKDELQVSLACALIELLSILSAKCLPNLQDLSQKFPEAFGFLQKAFTSSADAIQLSALQFILQFSKAEKILQREFTKMFGWQKIVHSLCFNLLHCDRKILDLKLRIILILAEQKEFVDVFLSNNTLADEIVQVLPNDDADTVSTVLQILEHFYQRQRLRQTLSQNATFFENVLKLCSDEWCDEVIICGLGIVFNSLHTNGDFVTKYSSQILDSASKLNESICLSKRSIHERNLRVLRQISHSKEMCEKIWSPKILENVVQFLQQYNQCSGLLEDLQILCRHATHFLAVLFKNVDQSLRMEYMDEFDNKGAELMAFIRISSKSTDFHGCANAALVLSFLLDSRACRRTLVKNYPDLCKELLSIASNNANESVRGNVAIALSKLVTHDEEQLAQLRKLDGLKILHDCIKFVN